MHRLHQSSTYWPTELLTIFVLSVIRQRSTVCNHPLKLQIGALWDAKAHQMSLLFLLSQPRRPGHQSWCVCKVHICILHFPRRPRCCSVGGGRETRALSWNFSVKLFFFQRKISVYINVLQFEYNHVRKSQKSSVTLDFWSKKPIKQTFQLKLHIFTVPVGAIYHPDCFGTCCRIWSIGMSAFAPI